MDLLVRYWGDNCNRITNRYLSQCFMGKPPLMMFWNILKIVISNFPLNSCWDISNLLAEMFNYSTANVFKLSPSKCWSLISYGLALYFSQLLEKKLDNSLFIATLLTNAVTKSIKGANGFTCKILGR